MMTDSSPRHAARGTVDVLISVEIFLLTETLLEVGNWDWG